MKSGELTRFELHGMQPVLPVPDVRATVDFYRDKLGFHIDFIDGEPPAHARVCADPTYSSPTVHIRFEPVPDGAASPPSVWLFLHVGAGLDQLFQLYRSRGVKIVREPTDQPWGLRQFVVRDCNGYRLSFSAELAAA
jgi:catechol 2,3-dioxygenase-like lactoylglutathione lyase family enzyme